MKNQISKGIIIGAEFGFVHDMPFLCGLRLRFKTDDGDSVGGDYVYNTEVDTNNSVKVIEKLNEILKQAKCNYVSELIGKAVSIVFKGNWNEEFDDFTFI